MKSILEKIFDGDTFVAFEDYKETREYAKMLEIRSSAAEEIENRMGIGSPAAGNFFEATYSIAEMVEREAFRKGFSLAVRLFLEALSENF